MPTAEECKKMLFRTGIKLGVSPKLISELLLDDIDKKLMMDGFIEIVELECHTEAWKRSGMPDYAHGKSIPLERTPKTECHHPEKNQKQLFLRPPFARE